LKKIIKKILTNKLVRNDKSVKGLLMSTNASTVGWDSMPIPSKI